MPSPRIKLSAQLAVPTGLPHAKSQPPTVHESALTSTVTFDSACPGTVAHVSADAALPAEAAFSNASHRSISNETTPKQMAHSPGFAHGKFTRCVLAVAIAGATTPRSSSSSTKLASIETPLSCYPGDVEDFSLFFRDQRAQLLIAQLIKVSLIVHFLNLRTHSTTVI